jgi:hypothetical protein
MGDDKLKVIAAELITQVRKSVTIDWTLRESARAIVDGKELRGGALELLSAEMTHAADA